jgi:hypothetical protein
MASKRGIIGLTKCAALEYYLVARATDGLGDEMPPTGMQISSE